jgi:hypothetical protein
MGTRPVTGQTTEYTECWPCPLFDIVLNKYCPAGLAWWQVGHPSVLPV